MLKQGIFIILILWILWVFLVIHAMLLAQKVEKTSRDLEEEKINTLNHEMLMYKTGWFDGANSGVNLYIEKQKGMEIKSPIEVFKEDSIKILKIMPYEN